MWRLIGHGNRFQEKHAITAKRYIYSTHDVLGEGRAARVYKGIDRRLGSPVAVKIYRDTDRTKASCGVLQALQSLCGSDARSTCRMCQHCFHNSIEMSSWLKRPIGRLPAGLQDL